MFSNLLEFVCDWEQLSGWIAESWNNYGRNTLVLCCIFFFTNDIVVCYIHLVLAGLLKRKLQLLPSGNLWRNFPSMFPLLINSSIILCRKLDFLSHNKCGYLSSSFAVLLKTRFSQCSIVWLENMVQVAPPWRSSSLYWSSQSQRNCLEPSAVDCSAVLTSKKVRLEPYFCSLPVRELSWWILGGKSEHSKVS